MPFLGDLIVLIFLTTLSFLKGNLKELLKKGQVTCLCIQFDTDIKNMKQIMKH